jgi:hypothetical protein
MFSSSGRLKMGSLFARLSRLRDSWLLGSASHVTAGSSPDDKVQTTCNARLGSVKKCTCFTIGNKSKAFMVFYSIYKSTVFPSSNVPSKYVAAEFFVLDRSSGSWWRWSSIWPCPERTEFFMDQRETDVAL